MRCLRILACSIVLAFAANASAAERRIAVMVGNNRADRTRERLQYAERDVRAMEEVLRTLGGVDEVEILLGRTPADLRAKWIEVEKKVAAASDPVTVFFYYSGHADERGLLMGDRRFEFSELRNTIEHLGAHLYVAMIDACQSGVLARGKGGSAVPVIDVDIRDAGPEQKGGVYITSGSSGEAAQESDEIKGSFFTHYLISGLRGGADDSGDRRVSLDEAYRFAYVNTLERTRGTLLGPQHPSWAVNVEGQGQLVLTWLNAERSYIVLPESSAGHWLVRNVASSDVFAELTKQKGKRMRIAVEPGAYEVARLDGDRAWAGRLDVAQGHEVEIDEKHLASVSLNKAIGKGDAIGGDDVVAAYHLSNGYLDEGGLIHGVRVGWMTTFDLLELGVLAHWGESSYHRTDDLQVSLRELGGAAHFGLRLHLTSILDVNAGLELGLLQATQRATHPDGRQQTLHAAVVPIDLVAGLDINLFDDFSTTLQLSGGATAYSNETDLDFAPAIALSIGLRYKL